VYSLFTRNVSGFLLQVESGSYIWKCFRPISLFADKNEFNKQKRKNSFLYQNAKLLVNEAGKLVNTKKYHRFGVFLREIDGEGIIFGDSPVEIEVEEDILTEQISLLWQCMFFNYVIV